MFLPLVLINLSDFYMSRPRGLRVENELCILGLLLVSFSLSTSSWETSNHSPDCELVLVQVVYRHGDRNPIEPYPTDPYKNESFWPGGYGQLTKIGKMQQYKLGQYIRERYEGFLNSTYSPYETYVQSSGVDRAMMSAEANLAGLYPPRDERSQWNPDLNWQPIPVHSKSDSIDNTIRYSELCPRYDELLHEFLSNSDVMQKVHAENKELFELMSNHTGKNITTVQDMDFTLDVLFIERLYNFTLPPWTNEIFPKYEKRLEDLAAFSFKTMTYTLELQRLRGGPLLKELIENMQGKMNGTMDVRRKFLMYSGHDTTISALLNTLDMYNDISPPYRSMVVLELHRNITSNTYFVEILYRNTTEREPYKMGIPGCSFSCDFPNFLELTRSRVPDDWEKECLPSAAVGYAAIGIVVTTMLLFILVGLCIAVGLILKSYLRNKRQGEPKPPKYPYLHLQMDEGEGDEEAT